MIVVADIRLYLEGYNIDASTLTDPFIQKQIDATVAKQERLTGKSFFATRTVTRNFHGDGSKTLQLHHWPIDVIDFIKIKYAGQGLPDTTLSSAEYILNKLNGQISILSSILVDGSQIFVWPLGHNNIETKYDYGYTAVPVDVEDALIKIIAGNSLMQVSGRDGGTGSLSIEGYTKTFGPNGKYTNIVSGWKKDAKSTLKSYRSIV